MDMTRMASGSGWKVGKQAIADHLQMSVKKLEEYLKSPSFPGRKEGKSYRVHAKDLDLWFRRVLRGDDIIGD